MILRRLLKGVITALWSDEVEGALEDAMHDARRRAIATIRIDGFVTDRIREAIRSEVNDAIKAALREPVTYSHHPRGEVRQVPGRGADFTSAMSNVRKVGLDL